RSSNFFEVTAPPIACITAVTRCARARPKSDGQSPNRSQLCLAGAQGDQPPIDSGVILLPHAALHRDDSRSPPFPRLSGQVLQVGRFLHEEFKENPEARY